jgi:hypothetical protein
VVVKPDNIQGLFLSGDIPVIAVNFITLTMEDFRQSRELFHRNVHVSFCMQAAFNFISDYMTCGICKMIHDKKSTFHYPVVMKPKNLSLPQGLPLHWYTAGKDVVQRKQNSMEHCLFCAIVTFGDSTV